jgi:predicted nucleic acid-binding Zn ribbon protein
MKDVKSTTDCIKCGEIANKIISPVNVIYKGKGFYNTDNKISKPIKEEGDMIG